MFSFKLLVQVCQNFNPPILNYYNHIHNILSILLWFWQNFILSFQIILSFIKNWQKRGREQDRFARTGLLNARTELPGQGLKAKAAVVWLIFEDQSLLYKLSFVNS